MITDLAPSLFMRGVRLPAAATDAAAAAQWRADLLTDRDRRVASSSAEDRGAIDIAYASALEMSSYEQGADAWPAPASVLGWLLHESGDGQDEA